MSISRTIWERTLAGPAGRKADVPGRDSPQAGHETEPKSSGDVPVGEEAPRTSWWGLEEEWGRRQRAGPEAKYALAAVCVLAVSILAVVAGVFVSRARFGAPAAEERSGALDFDQRDVTATVRSGKRSLRWFLNHSTEAYHEAVGILEALNRVDDPALVPEHLRDFKRVRDKIRAWGPGWSSDFTVARSFDIECQVGAVGDTGFLVVSGVREDFTPFRSYFVRTMEGLKLDWEATAGWSEVPVGKLDGLPPDEPVLIRCWMGKEPGFDTGLYPGSLRSNYILLSPDREDVRWASVPANGPLDSKLREVLDYGKWILDRKRKSRVILRVSKLEQQSGSGPSKTAGFEIRELVADDWVLP